MKKLLTFLFLVGFVGIAKADQKGKFDSFKGIPVWQSSFTMINEEWQILSTGPVMIGYVQVSSRGYNSEIKFLQCSSTVDFKSVSGTNEFTNFFGSTYPFVNGAGFPTNAIGSPYGDMIYVMLYSSAGWSYKTTGTTPAKLRVLFDEVK
jgi:hypothetical protein